jgi:hypothetical protein
VNNFTGYNLSSWTRNTKSTQAELTDAEGDKYHIVFETMTVDNVHSGFNTATLTCSALLNVLTDDQIADVIGAMLHAIFAQKDRAPEVVARLETIMRHHLGEGMAKDDDTLRKVDQAYKENTRSLG